MALKALEKIFGFSSKLREVIFYKMVTFFCSFYFYQCILTTAVKLIYMRSVLHRHSIVHMNNKCDNCGIFRPHSVKYS